jgi:hypothetical protein
MLASQTLRYILTISVYIVYLAGCQLDPSYLIGVGFVILLAHILPIVKLFPWSLLCKPSFSLRTVLPLFLVPQAVRSTVYILSLVSHSLLSYSFTLTLLLHFPRPSTISCIAWRLYPHSKYTFLLSLILQSHPNNPPHHFHLPVCALISPCHPFALRVIHTRSGLKGLIISCNVCLQ